ncbi:hypothetical protein CLIM01_12242 [Colletotrichum limetticola]|uniref:Uncharacterized protein n=1 Tax=Colletotrichum limetticola TaxID=1209924 RepID=A0ABQ9PEC5_9PEZI|nr:hypothetical protein CLIM01_12242 [Colletotrichum limetticola]
MALFPNFGFDLKNHSATIYDSGNESFTAMSIGRIGKPIAAVFKHPEETKNRYTATVSTEEARQEGKIKLQRGDSEGASSRGSTL